MNDRDKAEHIERLAEQLVTLNTMIDKLMRQGDTDTAKKLIMLARLLQEMRNAD